MTYYWDAIASRIILEKQLRQGDTNSDAFFLFLEQLIQEIHDLDHELDNKICKTLGNKVLLKKYAEMINLSI